MSVVIETVESRALVGNPLGDPTARRIAVWLPPSYARESTRRYPVIYWLAGYSGTGEMLFSGNPWQPGLDARLDRLVGGGAMGEAIVVAPDCFTRWGGAQYLDSPALGNYETHVVREVLPAIDGRYRTITTREARAIGGKSSGGFGALVLAMRHPELFAAVASHAGDAYFELSVLSEIPKVFRALTRRGGVAGFLRHFDAAAVKRSDDIAAMMMLAMSAAYAPDPTAPEGFALPFDLHTGELIASVWQRFKAWDPIELVAAPAHAQALRDMRLVYLDAGTRDEWGLDVAARVLAGRMRRLGVAVDHEEFEDGHMNTGYRSEVSLPKLAHALGAGGALPAPAPVGRAGRT